MSDVAKTEQQIHGTWVEPDRLTRHPENPRRGDVSAIMDSIRANGFYGAIVAQLSSGRVLAGNHRLEALRQLRDAGETVTHPPDEHGNREPLPEDLVPVMFVDVDDERARRILLADNRVADRAAYDDEALARLLQDLDDTTGTGWDQPEVADLLAAFEPDKQEPHKKPDLDVVPESPKAAISKPGDLWRLGPHRLLCGDNTDPEVVARLMGDALADCVVTDPPFAIYGSSTGVSTDVADDAMIRPFFEAMFRVIHANLRELGHCYVNCDWRSWPAVSHGAQRAAMSLKNCIVWDKESPGLGNAYANQHEFVGFFAKLAPNRTMLQAGKQRDRQRTISTANLVRFPRVMGAEREHNASKPVALLEFLIANSTDTGDLVLDLYGGSGSTLIAAQQAGRVCRMLDHDPKWTDVTCRRYQRATGELPVYDATGEEIDFGG